MKMDGETGLRAHSADQRKLRLNKTRLYATYNVHTLKKKGRFYELVSGCNKQHIDAVAIQEHRWSTDKEIESLWDLERLYQFLYASTDTRGQGGVGILLRKHIVHAVSTAVKVSPRIMSSVPSKLRGCAAAQLIRKRRAAVSDCRASRSDR